eukprot:5986662-Alexandrium_andersonii.AAC.1
MPESGAAGLLHPCWDTVPPGARPAYAAPSVGRPGQVDISWGGDGGQLRVAQLPPRPGHR